jgi:hypothetical protein
MSSAAMMFLQKRSKYASIREMIRPAKHDGTAHHIARKVKKVKPKARAA